MNLEYIDCLLGGNGQITLGRIGGVRCAAVASDESSCLAMLVRARNETLEALLRRLNDAIRDAVENDQFTDEINS